MQIYSDAMPKGPKHIVAALLAAVFVATGLSFCMPHFDEAVHAHDDRISLDHHLDLDHCSDGVEVANSNVGGYRPLQDHPHMAVLPVLDIVTVAISNQHFFASKSASPPKPSSRDPVVMRC